MSCILTTTGVVLNLQQAKRKARLKAGLTLRKFCLKRGFVFLISSAYTKKIVFG